MQAEDYGDWSDQELAEELTDAESIIETCQNSLGATRKTLNRYIDKRESLLDVIKQRGKSRGWPKK